LLYPSASASADQYVLTIQPGGPYSVGVGSELVRIRKQRPLPNAFGFADIFGRQVDTGLVQLIYFGRAAEGRAMLRRIDVDILSTATTMSRSPGFIWGLGSTWGTFSGRGGNFDSQVQVWGRAPTPETNVALPPRAFDFLADTSSTVPLTTGHELRLHRIEAHRVVFSIGHATSSGRRPGARCADDRC
jgi:hypothetical protein